MSFSLLIIIILTTVIVSLNAFQNRGLMDKLLYSPYRVKHNKEYYRILGHTLVHADMTHLIFNMLSLYLLGELLEQQFIFQYGQLYGELHFLFLYALGGVFATLIPYIRNHDNIHYKSIGFGGCFGSDFCNNIMESINGSQLIIHSDRYSCLRFWTIISCVRILGG